MTIHHPTQPIEGAAQRATSGPRSATLPDGRPASVNLDAGIPSGMGLIEQAISRLADPVVNHLVQAVDETERRLEPFLRADEPLPGGITDNGPPERQPGESELAFALRRYAADLERVGDTLVARITRLERIAARVDH